jgi:hypothetical protein
VWFIVPLIAVVAARFAVIPFRDHHAANDSRPSLIATTLLFTWTVAVLVLQGQLLRDLEHLLATVVAFALGLVLLFLWLPAEGRARRRALGTAAAAFVPLLFAIGLLMPSVAGAQYLFEIGLKKPVALTLKSGSYVEGRYERWYATDLDEGGAMSSVAASFRSPPVSMWPGAGGTGLTGLILGYRMEVGVLEAGVTSAYRSRLLDRTDELRPHQRSAGHVIGQRPLPPRVIHAAARPRRYRPHRAGYR